MRYGATLALDDVTVAVAPQQVSAVTGPSGSGKSTLLLCLAGLIQPTVGTAYYRERSLGGLSESKRSRLRRSVFGILFQFGQLIPEMTLAENVALPLLLDGQSRRKALGAATGMLDRLGVGELSTSKPSDVSGGQAQRAALARAMITGPEVLFADEPTGALDSASGRLVLQEMTALAREHGTAVVLVTHDAEVAVTADREITLHDGRITTDTDDPSMPR